MTEISKPIGRPPFRIDGTRLRDLRKGAGLTQRTLAKKAYDLAGKRASSDDVLKNTAQRWETKGAVPREMAQHLAQILGTTVAVLQGEAPPPAASKVDEFERLVHGRVASGNCPDLIEAIGRHGRDAENPERSLAAALSARLEEAQLTQSSELFDEIALLTGLNATELRQPMSHGGFWLLAQTGSSGPQRFEILSGVTEVLRKVSDELSRYFEGAGFCDSRATFQEEKPWFRITLSNNARVHGTDRVLRFVRCEPNERGLQWIRATWLDRFWIEELPGEAYSHACFVTGFDGAQVPSKVANLRLAIIKIPALDPKEPAEMNRPDEVVALTRGSLDELPDETMKMFESEHQTHYLVVNWLRNGLWEAVKPLLSEWPLDFWRIRMAQSRIEVHLEVPRRVYQQRQAPTRQGHLFTVFLVEELNGSLKRMPWNRVSVSHVFEALERDFNDACAALTEIGEPSP